MLQKAIERMQQAFSNWNMISAISDPHREAAAWAEYMAAAALVESIVQDKKRECVM